MKRLTIQFALLMMFVLFSFSACNGTSLNASSALFGAGSDAQSVNVDSGLNAGMTSDDPVTDPADANAALDLPDDSSSYFVDANGDVVAVAGIDGDVADASFDAGGMAVDDDYVTSTSSVTGADQATTDGNTDEGSTELDEITLMQMPVTISKNDGTDDSGSSCDSENRETVSMAYDDSSGDTHYMRRAAGSGRLSDGLHSLAQAILGVTTDDSAGPEMLASQYVFFASALSLKNSDSETDVTPVTCQADQEGHYSWHQMSPADLSGFEIATGAVRVHNSDSVQLVRDVLVTDFTGSDSTLTLQAKDFGLTSELQQKSHWVPYIILRRPPTTE